MKKNFLSFLFLLCFTAQHIQARAVLSGESLWAMQRLVTQASCDVTIRQIDFTAGVYTISNSGVYCLAENITGKIVIDTNNVVLDLNSKTITNTTANCVEVNGISQAFIRNGSVIAANNSGISVLSGSARVMVEHVATRNCVTGIEVDGSDNIYIDACDLIASHTGMFFNNVLRAEVHSTTASDSLYAGFELDASSKNFFASCRALNTGQGLIDLTADIYGFLSTNGSSNIFSSCVAQNTLALTVTGVSNVTAGFALTGTESKSQITKCTSTIVETNANGFAIPYGILLQYSFDTLTTVTGGNQGASCSTVAWSPDGAYLATGGQPEGSDEIQIFSFDRVAGTLTLTDTQDQDISCKAVSWSPDGAYLATVGLPEDSDEIQIFSFDRAIGRLTKIDGQDQGALGKAVAWSPDGVYLATGGSGGGDDIQVFFFDRSAETLTKLDGKLQGTNCSTVAWSPDGTYLATGGGAQVLAEIQIFPFDRASGTLGARTDGKNQGTECRAVSWSPDGAYLATGGEPEPGPLDVEIQLFSFNRATGTLTKTDEQSQGVDCNAVSWSPDGAYLATAGDREPETIGDEIQVFSFNRETELLTTVTRARQAVGQTVDWSPDGAYLATGGSQEALNEFQVFKAFLFPSRNVITNNTVQSASRSSSLAAGVGISGSSIENAIMVNSSYDNGGFNYWFVTNVFDERFATIPTAIQNLSIELPPPFLIP